MKYTFGNIPTTKGEMTKILKRYGVRTADTADGRTVGIKHLKYEELCVLFDDFAETEITSPLVDPRDISNGEDITLYSFSTIFLISS